MLRSHAGLLLNWFRAKGTMSSGSVEGLNYNAKLTMRKAYGFQTLRGVKIALYHRLGTSRSRGSPTNSADEAYFKTSPADERRGVNFPWGRSSIG